MPITLKNKINIYLHRGPQNDWTYYCCYSQVFIQRWCVRVISNIDGKGTSCTPCSCFASIIKQAASTKNKRKKTNVSKCEISEWKTKENLYFSFFFILCFQLVKTTVHFSLGNNKRESGDVEKLRVKSDIYAQNVLIVRHSTLYLFPKQQWPGTVRMCQLWVVNVDPHLVWAKTHCEPCYYIRSCWAVSVHGHLWLQKGLQFYGFFFSIFIFNAITGQIWTNEVKQQEVSCRPVLVLLCVCTDVYWITSTSGYTAMRKLKCFFTRNAHFFRHVYFNRCVQHEMLSYITAQLKYFDRTAHKILVFFFNKFLCTQPWLSIRRASVLLRDYHWSAVIWSDGRLMLNIRHRRWVSGWLSVGRRSAVTLLWDARLPVEWFELSGNHSRLTVKETIAKDCNWQDTGHKHTAVKLHVFILLPSMRWQWVLLRWLNFASSPQSPLSVDTLLSLIFLFVL